MLKVDVAAGEGQVEVVLGGDHAEVGAAGVGGPDFDALLAEVDFDMVSIAVGCRVTVGIGAIRKTAGDGVVVDPMDPLDAADACVAASDAAAAEVNADRVTRMCPHADGAPGWGRHGLVGDPQLEPPGM